MARGSRRAPIVRRGRRHRVQATHRPTKRVRIAARRVRRAASPKGGAGVVAAAMQRLTETARMPRMLRGVSMLLARMLLRQRLHRVRAAVRSVPRPSNDRPVAADERRTSGGSMSPSRPFIMRPVATALLMVAIVLAGLVGFRLLPVSALPQVDYPTIQVQTLYPGASPEVMANTVTAPLERQFGQMAGLERMSSTSASGVSVITLQFSLELSLDVAEQEVQAAINASGSLLPADLPAPPVYAKVNPADAPVLTLAVSSDSMPLTDVQNLVSTRLAQKISQVSGVGLVSLSGGQRPAVRIQANTQALASYGIGMDTLRTAIANANSNAAKGNFDGPKRAYSISSNDQLLTADDYKQLIVAYRNGAPVRIANVADVVESAENNQLGAWAGLPCTNEPKGRLAAAELPGDGCRDQESG